MRIPNLLPWLILAFAALGSSKCSHVKTYVPDVKMSAVEAGDFTALNEVDGCGPQVIDGFNYCRRMEGQGTGTSFAFIGPPVTCKSQDACVFFKIYFPSGEPSYGGKIPVGQTRVSVAWKTLTGKDTFDLGDRGEWPYNYEIHWLNQKDEEQVSYSQGEIVLRVYKKGYEPLDRVTADPNFVWNWIENGQAIKMTTGMRTYIGPLPDPSPKVFP